jgi:hypothetical protein
MKQLKLPFMSSDNIDALYVYELFLYTPDSTPRNRTYSKNVGFTLAKDLNQAEGLFQNKHPEWWRSMGVKKVEIDEVYNMTKVLETQLDACKFIIEAYNITSD